MENQRNNTVPLSVRVGCGEDIPQVGERGKVFMSGLRIQVEMSVPKTAVKLQARWAFWVCARG